MVSNTNLYLNIRANSFGSNLSFTATPVAQKFKVPNIDKTKKLASALNSVDSEGFITKSFTPNVSVVSRTNPNTKQEVSSLTIDAKVPYKKRVQIATVSLSAKAGYSIINEPFIIYSSTPIAGLSLYLEKGSSKTSFNLFCELDNEVRTEGVPTFEISYIVTNNAPAKTARINKVVTGGNLTAFGCTRTIKVIGTPNTPFNLSILNSEDNNSILTAANSITTLPVGVKQCLTATTGKSGIYRFKQFFPGAPSKRLTTVNGNFTNEKKVIFTSLTDVLVGDELRILTEFGQAHNPGKAITVVELDPDGDNVNECLLSDTITATTGRKASFNRPISYDIHLNTTAELADTFKRGYPSLTVTQSSTPRLVFTVFTANNLFLINGVAPSVSGNSESNYLSGERYKHKFKRYTFEVRKTNGASVTQNNTNFNKAVINSVSGNAKCYADFSSTGSGTNSYTLTVDLNVNQFGTGDSVKNFDLDNIIS